jgi:membrane fusion protein, multidrug efflux system
MKLKWPGIFVIVVVVGLATYQVMHGFKQQKAGDADIKEVPVSVTVAEVQRRELPLTFVAVGRVEAKASIAVKSRLDGQVAEVAYTEGRPVHKGQLLLRFDPAVFEAQQRQSEDVLARDQAQLTRLKEDYQRNKALLEQEYISKRELSQSEADLHAAEATLKADHASLDIARLQLDYTRITAPMDGVAGAVLLPVGGAAKANDTTLLVLNQIKPIYVSFSLPEAQLASLKQAMTRGQVAISASVAGVDKSVAGKLAFIDNAIDTTSGTITAKAIFDNADGVLTPGQFAQVVVQLDKLADALVVPSQAVENGIDGHYVFVIRTDSTVEIRQIKIGAEAGNFSVVTAGLAVGERVVTNGQARLRNASKVTVTTTADQSGKQ